MKQRNMAHPSLRTIRHRYLACELRGLPGSAQFRPRTFVFQTVNIVLGEAGFHNRIGQIAEANMLQGCGKKFSCCEGTTLGTMMITRGWSSSLPCRLRMSERLLVTKVYSCSRMDSDELPILEPAESAVTDMVGAVAS